MSGDQRTGATGSVPVHGFRHPSWRAPSVAFLDISQQAEGEETAFLPRRSRGASYLTAVGAPVCNLTADQVPSTLSRYTPSCSRNDSRAVRSVAAMKITLSSTRSMNTNGLPPS
jgi:hypothetical protein